MDSSQDSDVFINTFMHIEIFFKGPESYVEVPPTALMTDVIAKMMIEVLLLLAIATEEVNLGRLSELTLYHRRV